MDARSIATREMPLPRLTVAAAITLCGLLVSLSGLLLARRISGGFVAGLSPAPFLAMGGSLLAAIALPRIAGVWFVPPRERLGLRLALLTLPALAGVTMLATLSSGSLSPWPLALVWLAVAVEEGIWWTLYFRQRRAMPSHEVPWAELEPAGAPISENVLQQLTRVRAEDGTETLFGVLRADFLARERNQNLHVAFCPPLARVPELMFEQVDGPSATIKIGQVEAFGARLEVRLDSVPQEAARILVEFSTCPPPG